MSNINNNCYGQIPPLDVYTKAEIDAFLLEKANLTSNNKLVETEVPDLAITNVFSGEISYRDNLVNDGTIETGDVFIDTTNNITYMYNGANFLVIENAGFATIDDINTSQSTTFSSNYIETNYFKKNDLVNQHSTDTTKGYNVIYLNTELDNKLNKVVLNGSSSGTSLFSLAGNQLTIKRITGTGITENNGLITINQRASEIDDVNISSSKTFSSDKTETIYLKITNLINSGGSNSTQSTYTANRINELINDQLVGVMNETNSGIALHNDISNDNKIILKSISGTGVSENNGLITINQANQIDNSNASLTTAYSSQTSNSRYILVSNKTDQTSTDTNKIYNVVYLNTQLSNKLSKNVIDNNDNTASPIFSLSGDVLSLKRIKGTAVSEASNTFTINKLTTPEVRGMVISDINGTAHSDRTFSSIYLNNNFFLQTNLVNTHSTSTSQTYNSSYINTQLSNRLSTSVSNKSSATGHQIFEVDGQNLKLWKLNAGTNVNIVDSSPNAGVLTISSTDSVPTSGSVVGPNIQVNNSNGTSFNIDVSSLQADVHLSSGAIVGSNLRLYYDTYDANNPSSADYFDVDITSLQNSGGSGSTSGSAIYAYSITSANKTQLNYSGLNLTSDTTDYYNYTFAQAVSNANYGISCQHEGLSTDTDTNSYIENKTVNGFQLFFAVGDNSTVTDAPIIRCNHSVQIYGLGAGGSGANTYVNSGSIVGNNIRLVLSDNSQVDVDITSLQSANTTVVSNHTDVCSISNNNELNFPDLQLSRSGSNTFVGKNANIYSSSLECVFVGQDAGWNSSGNLGSTNCSVFVGKQAGQQAWGCDHSVLIGFKSGYDRRNPNTIAIGTEAGRAGSYGTSTEGESYNTYIGRECGRAHSGSSRCIFLGPKVGMNDNSGVDGQLRIGADSSKELIYGVMNSAHSNSEFWVNANTVCLGSLLPSSQPSEARQIWRTSTGHLAQGAVSSISNGQKGEPGVGTKGEPGVGTKGEPGQSITGQKGETGVGLKGEPGVGIKGEPGVGLKGEPGVATNGLNGDKGEPGVGIKGTAGLKGSPGQKGETGDKGDIGVGQKGSKGDIGVGQKGSKGEDGQTASKGEQGDIGIKGQKGVPGVTGNVYWQGGKGDKGEPGNSANQAQSNFTETNTSSVQFILNKPTIRTDNNLCLVGRTNNQASYGVEIGNNNRALISGVCNVSDTTSRINLNAKQIFAPDITHITQSTTATNQIWRHYGSGVLVQNGFTPSGLFPPSGNSKYFITIDPNNNNVIWRDSLIFDSNRKISFDTANIAVKLINKNADLENEDVGKIDFHGENQNLYGTISTCIKSSTNNSRKSYMRFNVCDGSGNNVNEIFRIGQGVFSGDSDCSAEFYNGRVKFNSIKLPNGVQERAITTPSSGQNNYIIRANNNGTWDWSPENTGSNTSEIDDNSISSTKTWSSSEIHHNVVKGSFQDVSISNRTITFTRYNDNDITKTLFTPTIWSNVAIGGIYLRDDLLNILSNTTIYPSFANNSGKVLTTNGTSVSWQTPSSNTIINSADTNLISITNNDTVGINTNHINIRPVRLGKFIGQTSRTDSVLIGEYCGHNIINNEPFTLIGGYSGYKTDTSTYKLRGFSVGIGTYSLFETGGQSAGEQNVAIGDLALSYNEGDYVSRNTAVGFEAMRGMEAGDKYMNTAVGWRAGKGAGNHDDCLYLGPLQGSTNSASSGHASRLMIGNQYHTLIDGKMENSNPTFKINAGHIEMDVSNMPTGYNGSFPNRVYLDNGLLRVGVKKNDTIYAYSITQANGTQLNSSGMSCSMTTTVGTNPVTTTTYTYTFPVATPSNDYGISVQQENASVDVNSFIISKTGTGFQLEFGNTTRYLIAHSVMLYGI